jgi:hypothetical protein
MSTPAEGFDSVLLRTIAAADRAVIRLSPTVASNLGGGTHGMRPRYSRPVTSLDTAETACYSSGRNIEAYFETDFVPAFAISWAMALPTQFVSLQFSVTQLPARA